MSGKTYLTNQKYFKPNYFEAIKYIIPQYLTEDDITTFGNEVDIKDQVINSHLTIASDLSSVLIVSGVEDTVYSSVSSLEGIAPYFVKQNGLTNVTTERFERKILSPLGKSILDYKTSASFSSYVTDTLLPSLALNSPTAVFNTGDDPSATHNYLIENLSWMYFLNTTGTYFDPSSYVSDLLVNKVYFGKPILTNDGIKGLMEHVWKNKKTGYYPATTFASSTDTYVSGTQQLENLKTWVDVIYSPLHSDKSDFTVRDRFETYIDSSLTTENKIPNGPFTKFLRALSFVAFDIDNQSELLSTLYDIDECPDEFLPLIAELIGWDLFGSDPSRWRLQLKNAVTIYKSIGTKKSLQFAMNSVFPKDMFALESKVTEVYESYIPFLIYYALATESQFFKSLATWTPTLAEQMNVEGYSTSSLDENLKLATDRILYEVYLNFKGTPGFQPFPKEDNGFFYRGRTYPVPPFEEYPYYANFEVTKEVVDFITDRLACFGVRQDFALDVSGYLNDNVIDVDEEARAGSFLFFTSGYNEPPNISRIVQDLNNENFEYVSLWSGKSSHFKVMFDAASFDFDKKGIALDQSDSGDAVMLASQITREMAPAHSIPLINLQLSSVDPLSLDGSSLPLVILDKVEIESGATRNYFLSGLNVGSYKRGYATGGKEIGRGATETLASPELLTATTAESIPRKSLRRRSYDKLMSFNGYYDRTGFNMPTTFQMTEELSGISLGLIPSSCQYTPVSDHVNLPAIWGPCETLKSDSSYYEYAVSNTLASRGGKIGPVKNLIIFAGQSNFNGVGTSPRDAVTGVKYWDITTSSFTTLIPGTNSSVNSKAGTGDAPAFGDKWGPEVKFAELLKDFDATEDNYIFKFCADNSWVIDTQASNVGPLSADTYSAFLGTRIVSLKDSTWCPSSSRSYNLYDKFASSLDTVIDHLGGSGSLNNVYFMWNQGETESGRGQDGNSIANQYKEFTEGFLDEVKLKFDSRRLKLLRVKINENMGSGSEADWQYYSEGTHTDASSNFPAAAGLDILGIWGNTSDPGSYGNWSWSSTPTVRAAQEAMDTSLYGQLLDLDDVSIAGSTESIVAGIVSSVSYNDSHAAVGLGASAIQHYVYKDYTPSNVHYTEPSIDIMGERLFNSWANDTGLLQDKYQRDVRNDRGQLPDIYAAMHEIREGTKVMDASAAYGPVSLYIDSASNVYQSYANSATEASGWFPNNVEDYYNFSFGKDLHKLYTIYTSTFEWHQMNERLQYVDGANLFSHTYGPILYNHDLEDVLRDSDFLASSIDAITYFSPVGSLFTGDLSYAASNATDMYLDTSERVVSGAVSGVELIHTSGSQEGNMFSIFKIDSQYKKATDDPYMYDNTFILSRSTVGGLPRVRFDMSKYDAPSDRPIATNFLVPDHEQELKVKALVTIGGNNFGGRDIGMWIHTKPEGGKMWSYTSNGQWEQHDQLVGRQAVISNYAHVTSLPLRSKEINPVMVSGFECIDSAPHGYSYSPCVTPVSRLNETDFEELSVKFNTSNRSLLLPYDYQKTYEQLHRKDQQYVIEVFMVPNGSVGEFMLLDTVKLQDLTLKKMSEIFVNGKYHDPECIMPEVVGNCAEYRYPLTKDRLRQIFKFFNNIAGKNSAEGLASRDAFESSAIMDVSGGSRLDYRTNTNWMDSVIRGTYVINQINIDV
jgi:hypothetical protein